MGFHMSTLTQFLSGKLKSQEFLSSGTYTVPAGVTTVWVTMCGGGGSGGTAGTATYGAAGGGAGAYVIKQAVSVTPGASVTVTIGAGGTGVAADSTGNSGGTTSFGSLSVLGGTGGGHAASQTSTHIQPGNGGARGGFGKGSSLSAVSLAATSCGGRAGLTSNADGGLSWAFQSSASYGGGAGGLFGDGTNGNNSAASTSASANSGAGSGGSRFSSGTGGAGGSGRCIVEWLE